MIKLIYLDNPNEPEYSDYIRKAIRMVYADKLIPEQLLIPEEVTVDKILRGYRSCVLIALEDTSNGTLIATLLSLGEESPHVIGDVASCAITVGNTSDSKLVMQFIRTLQRIAKASGHSWLQVHHRLAPYTYRAKYYKV